MLLSLKGSVLTGPLVDGVQWGHWDHGVEGLGRESAAGVLLRGRGIAALGLEGGRGMHKRFPAHNTQKGWSCYLRWRGREVQMKVGEWRQRDAERERVCVCM